MDAETMVAASGHNEFSVTHCQQIIDPQDTPDLLLPGDETGALDQSTDAPVSVAPMRQRRALHRIAQCRLGLARLLLLPFPIETGPAHACQFAHPLDGQLALRFPATDFVVDAVPP